MDDAVTAAEAAQKNYFKKGSVVEVSLEEEGFRGSWYTATVLRNVSKKNNNNHNNNKIFLQFHTLMADDDGAKPHKEFVDIILVRPKPPREPKRTFHLNEEVDAYHNDGWWEGIITQVLPPSPSTAPAADSVAPTRYSVFFRSSREQIVFPEPDLRLHREWVHGEWVPPLEPDAAQAQQEMSR